MAHAITRLPGYPDTTLVWLAELIAHTPPALVSSIEAILALPALFCASANKTELRDAAATTLSFLCTLVYAIVFLSGSFVAQAEDIALDVAVLIIIPACYLTYRCILYSSSRLTVKRNCKIAARNFLNGLRTLKKELYQYGSARLIQLIRAPASIAALWYRGTRGLAMVVHFECTDNIGKGLSTIIVHLARGVKHTTDLSLGLLHAVLAAIGETFLDHLGKHPLAVSAIMLTITIYVTWKCRHLFGTAVAFIKYTGLAGAWMVTIVWGGACFLVAELIEATAGLIGKASESKVIAMAGIDGVFGTEHAHRAAILAHRTQDGSASAAMSAATATAAATGMWTNVGATAASHLFTSYLASPIQSLSGIANYFSSGSQSPPERLTDSARP
jgi:hypothetical protein